MLDPMEFYENMDLELLKEEYGDRITFWRSYKFLLNGMKEKMEEALKDVLSTGEKVAGIYLWIHQGQCPKTCLKRNLFSI